MVIQWDLHEQTRTRSLNNLWKDEDFLDVTLACEDGQVEAHKVILSTSSTFFHKIFKRNLHTHPLLYLRGTRRNDLLSLLDFIYSGETQVPEEELGEFMAIANSLDVKGLTGSLLAPTDFVKSKNKSEASSNLLERLIEDEVPESLDQKDKSVILNWKRKSKKNQLLP